MKNSLTFFFLLIGVSVMGQVDNNCDMYNTLLLHESEKESIEVLDDEDLQNAINCFIRFKGNKKANNYWSEFTNPKEEWEYYSNLSVKNYFNSPSNQFVALYLISAFYYKDFLFTKKIELIYTDQMGNEIRFTDLSKVNNPSIFQKMFLKSVGGSTKIYYKPANKKLMKKVYKLYKIWVREMNEKGIKYLRENKISPLRNSNFSWE